PTTDVIAAAHITAVVGSAYTSVSFIRTLRAGWERHTTPLIIGFIVASTTVFLVVGRPVAILIVVGALNALVLPIGLAAMLLASRRADLMGGYRHPLSLTVAGTVVAVAMAGLGAYTLVTQVPGLFK
ncbi:MAG: hypothetical protein HOP28_13345, partial [Gemmatimonadales bacterium]|nr:hypothetical protein [Gemmatimonadales bacterium]